MKNAIPFIAFCTIPAILAQDIGSISSHQEYTAALLDLLAETELCLSQCVDEASVDASLEHLQELSDKMEELKKKQKELAEPTMADYIAAEQQIGEFNTLWNGIKQQIQRLDNENLYSKQMLEIIKLVN